jgi:hypothetical protein
MTQKHITEKEIAAANAICSQITFTRIREVDKPTHDTGWIGGIHSPRFELYLNQSGEKILRIVKVPQLGYFQLDSIHLM